MRGSKVPPVSYDITVAKSVADIPREAAEEIIPVFNVKGGPPTEFCPSCNFGPLTKSPTAYDVFSFQSLTSNVGLGCVFAPVPDGVEYVEPVIGAELPTIAL